MIFNLENVDPPKRVNYDICIIGSGAAGITAARALRNTKLKIALIESGDAEFAQQTQDLCSGFTKGYLPPQYPLESRLRYFGGSTNHWSGIVRPFNENNFISRQEVSLPGWPILMTELLPYYSRASKVCGVADFDLVDEKMHQAYPISVEGRVSYRPSVYQISPSTRFADIYRSEIEESSNIDIWLKANIIDFQLSKDKKTIKKIIGLSSRLNKFEIKAKHVFLCAGGIENARILLNAKSHGDNGFSNSSGAVGRYFMEHHYHFRKIYLAHFMSDEMVHFFSRQYVLPQEIAKKQRPINTINAFSPTSNLLKEKKALSFFIEFFSQSYQVSSKVTEQAALLAVTEGSAKPRYCQVVIGTEQSPEYDNRCALSGERDILGLRKVVIESKLSNLDLHTAECALKGAAQIAGALNLGRIFVESNDFINPGYGCHHMGTTRMGMSPKNSVVDKNLKSHDCENLYILGSSVFPTSGCVNPTLTIVALSLRLADHILKLYDKGMSV